MKVTFLQHQDSLPPGKLGEYLVARQGAVTKVLQTHEVREDHEDVVSADLLVSLGHPLSVYRTDVEWVARERRIIAERLARGAPVLGICFGAQMIASLSGGSSTEIGRSYIGWWSNNEVAAPVWRGPWFRFHREQCLHPAAQVLARSEGVIQAFTCGNAIGVQFHPEMDAAIAAELAPAMQRDFDLTPDDTRKLIEETRVKVEEMKATREALFDEVLRLFRGI